MGGFYNRGEPNWRRFEEMARRGFDRLSGELGGMGGNFRIGRMLASGDLRLVALYLIEEQPRHGYDLIKAIEERSHGVYSPSPGIVYPALTYLEEAGFATSSAEGSKKLYTITDAGRAHLDDNREAIQSTLDFLGKAGERMGEWRERMRGEFDEGRRGEHRGWRPERSASADRDIADVLPEVNAARRALKAAIAEAVKGDEDAQRRLARILNRAAQKIERIKDAPGEGIDL